MEENSPGGVLGVRSFLDGGVETPSSPPNGWGGSQIGEKLGTVVINVGALSEESLRGNPQTSAVWQTG